MTLGAPIWLNLLWLLPPLALLLIWAQRRRSRDLASLISAGLLERYLPALLPARFCAQLYPWMSPTRALTLGCDLGRERRSASGGLSLPYGASTASCYGQFVVG